MGLAKQLTLQSRGLIVMRVWPNNKLITMYLCVLDYKRLHLLFSINVCLMNFRIKNTEKCDLFRIENFEKIEENIFKKKRKKYFQEK